MTELMKRYEKETGEKPKKKVLVMYSTKRYGWGRERNSFFFTNKFVAWLLSQLDKYQAKATTYDRIMSGGRKTLKDWANMFGMVVAIDQNGEVACFEHIPVMCHDRGEGIWKDSPAHFGEEIYLLPPHLIDFDGDWKDSLTLPDGWEDV